MSPGGSNELLSMESAATYLDVPKRTLQDNYRKWGIAHVWVGRCVKFRKRHLDSWIDSNTVTP